MSLWTFLCCGNFSRCKAMINRRPVSLLFLFLLILLFLFLFFFFLDTTTKIKDNPCLFLTTNGVCVFIPSPLGWAHSFRRFLGPHMGLRLIFFIFFRIRTEINWEGQCGPNPICISAQHCVGQEESSSKHRSRVERKPLRHQPQIWKFYFLQYMEILFF